MYAYAEKYGGKIFEAWGLLERTQGKNLSSIKLSSNSTCASSLAVTSENKGNILKQEILAYYLYI